MSVQESLAIPHSIISRLGDLGSKDLNDPHKNADAFEAIKLASTLFDYYAGWARDHMIGRIVDTSMS